MPLLDFTIPSAPQEVSGGGPGPAAVAAAALPAAGLAPGFVATDSEWDPHLKIPAWVGKRMKPPWVSTAFATDRGTVVFLPAFVPLETRLRLRPEARKLGGVRLLYGYRDDGTNLLAQALPVLYPGGDAPKEIRLAHYYSPKDVEFALG